MRWAATRAVALGAAVFALAGCGVSPKAFIAKADPVCKAGDKALSGLAAPTDMASLQDFATKLSAAGATVKRQLSVLEAPGGEPGTKVESMISGLSAGSKGAGALADAAGQADFPGAETAAADTSAAFKKSDDAFRTFGMRECGRAEAAAAQTLSAATGPILKRAYIDKAEDICKKYTKEFNAVGKPPSDLTGVKSFFERLGNIFGRLQADLRAIPSQAADKPALDEWLAARDKFNAKVAEELDAVNRGDYDRLPRLTAEVKSLADEARALADRFGFKHCGADRV